MNPVMREQTGERMIRRQKRHTWGQVLGKAAGVDQDVGLEGGVKVVICAEEGERWSWNVTGRGWRFWFVFFLLFEVFYLL